MKIGIIGVGFVGRAILAAYEKNKISVVLRDPACGYHATINDIKQTDAVFVCVPSPPLETGRCDTGILESVLAELKDYTGVIISKVTAPPNEYRQLQEQYPNLVYAPEFLTAANAVEDYRNSEFVIVGGAGEKCKQAIDAILSGFNRVVPVRQTSIAEASLAKYTINTFLATKVAFMNELYEIAQKENINYNTVADLVKLDSRIGTSHMQVPGPGGGRGFAGACFPKDTEALRYYAQQAGVDFSILNQAIESNKIIRSK